MKMRKILVLLLAICLYQSNLMAQITQKYLNVDMGVTGFVNDLPDNLKIKCDQGTYEIISVR